MIQLRVTQSARTQGCDLGSETPCATAIFHTEPFHFCQPLRLSFGHKNFDPEWSRRPSVVTLDREDGDFNVLAPIRFDALADAGG
jgi:hypothetical protein